MSPKREPKDDYVPRPEAPERAKPATRDTDLSSSRWKLATVAWTPEGNIVVLDPALREKLLELRDRDDELVIGLPPASGAQVGKVPGEAKYDPWPDGEPKRVRIPTPLELCVCDGRLLKLVKTFKGHIESAPAIEDGASVGSRDA